MSRHQFPWALYDLEADRSELIDLALQQPAKTAELQAKYAAWAKRADVMPWPVAH